MEEAYAAADLVISRSGAMAVAELCVVKKPVVFVPYPFAAEDHQTVNAMNLVKRGAAQMVKDNEAGTGTGTSHSGTGGRRKKTGRTDRKY
jgi:UDP-N-acetylglucosamine--N-acetylmuramyl-(pentapeptide) pyrophosphoryl-undecaprenol N-acetylglucosamine transferase